MHLQAALCQPCLKLGLEGLRFLLVPAVHQPIVCIPTPREVGVRPRHPEIERVVQEQVCQNRADHTPLRGAAAFAQPIIPSSCSIGAVSHLSM